MMDARYEPSMQIVTLILDIFPEFATFGKIVSEKN